MSGGSINWGGFNSDPQITEAKNQASGAYNLADGASDDIYDLSRGKYTKGGYSFIRENYIYSPNIQGGNITADTYINVGADVNIGHQLTLNGVDFGNGIIWKNKAGDKMAEIYIDPISKYVMIPKLNIDDYNIVAKFA